MMHLFLRRWLLLGVLLLCSAESSCAQADNSAFLPDSKLTPGDTLDVTLQDIRTIGYSSKVRNVPIAVKREVYALYGVHYTGPGKYEVDHLIPLCLGGSNSVRNLWPESYLTTPWNAHVKDRLESRLLALVREGKVDLKTAQSEIAHDWIAAYLKYVGPAPRGTESPKELLDPDGPETDSATETAPGQVSRPTTTEPAGADQVWVNTKSGVIWPQGSQFYGKTKEGKYMPAADAVAAGYHYAGQH